MRIFLGIFPPSEVYGRFFADVFKFLDKQKRNLDFFSLEQIHLNIKFIGANVSESSYKTVIDFLKQFEGQYTKPEIKIKRVQFGFDHQLNPNYIVADVEESDSLLQLSEEIHKLIKYLKLKDTILWKEKHSNKFHISLARKKKDKNTALNRQLKELMKNFSLPMPDPFQADSLYVVQSILTNKKPVYKRRDRILL
ncbi:RNA 2',3'-cyclic phosphodiesterase [Candidatus Dojkabacteria bacterium]|uniref:RNA 2',3'-cyclic phosphodiesterase n=1 Tax=Candidatus Dojkabacteria bacterium TaxID=2099670 RepID=A0A3M0Z1U1_9BACT|nr:MAG: RNA 2',3'-cyclic phosphodiesterase [Candidatus Dojkabacteria bacterium]